jgi:hypothetical protein
MRCEVLQSVGLLHSIMQISVLPITFGRVEHEMVHHQSNRRGPTITKLSALFEISSATS